MASLAALLPASPLKETLLAAAVLQGLGAAICIPLKEDRFYDLFGSLGFISSVGISLYYPTLRTRLLTGQNVPFPSLLCFHPRQVLASAMTVLWAGRLGYFLFTRALKHGGDSRFDEIKKDPKKFAGAWTGQIAWITLTGLPVYLLNALPPSAHPALGVRDFLGVGLWTGAFLLEVIADRQKSTWREEKTEKKHEEAFIKSGLCAFPPSPPSTLHLNLPSNGTGAYSRHPNYVGEVLQWTSLSLLASRPLSAAYSPLAAKAAFASPLLEYLLIRYVSGVSLQEKASDQKFGSGKKGEGTEWEEYKRRVPVFWPTGKHI